MKTPNSAPQAALAWLRLCLVPGVNPSMQQRALERFGSPEGVLAAGREELAAVIGPEAAGALLRGAAPALLERTLAWLARPGHALVSLRDEGYPEPLRHIDEAPTLLYVQGRPELLAAPCFAIVGSRNASTQGRLDAEAFARELSEAGLCIVSGLALGIDAAAHRGGLAGAGSSIAVVGTGLDSVYPPENAALAGELRTGGCIVSEFPLGMPPLSGNFPRRNRLITGLARGVLVVEAGDRSGTLITARYALEQGREVLALPGSIHSSLAKGCNRLIKQGAKLVETADDIFEELRWPRPGRAAPAEADARDERDPLLEALGFAPASIDDIAERTSLATRDIAARLTRLEIEGCIEAVPGGRFRRLHHAPGRRAKTAL